MESELAQLVLARLASVAWLDAHARAERKKGKRPFSFRSPFFFLLFFTCFFTRKRGNARRWRKHDDDLHYWPLATYRILVVWRRKGRLVVSWMLAVTWLLNGESWVVTRSWRIRSMHVGFFFSFFFNRFCGNLIVFDWGKKGWDCWDLVWGWWWQVWLRKGKGVFGFRWRI